MANASIEYGKIASAGSINQQVHADCVKQETLAISGTTATGAVVVAAVDAINLVRIATDDTGCFVAVGSTPDPTAQTQTGATTAKRYVPAGGVLEMPILAGQKVAVHS